MNYTQEGIPDIRFNEKLQHISFEPGEVSKKTLEAIVKNYHDTAVLSDRKAGRISIHNREAVKAAIKSKLLKEPEQKIIKEWKTKDGKAVRIELSLDKDGKLTAREVNTVRRALAPDKTTYSVPFAFDYDGDGIITLRDCYLFFYDLQTLSEKHPLYDECDDETKKTLLAQAEDFLARLIPLGFVPFNTKWANIPFNRTEIEDACRNCGLSSGETHDIVELLMPLLGNITIGLSYFQRHFDNAIMPRISEKVQSYLKGRTYASEEAEMYDYFSNTARIANLEGQDHRFINNWITANKRDWVNKHGETPLMKGLLLQHQNYSPIIKTLSIQGVQIMSGKNAQLSDIDRLNCEIFFSRADEYTVSDVLHKSAVAASYMLPGTSDTDIEIKLRSFTDEYRLDAIFNGLSGDYNKETAIYKTMLIAVEEMGYAEKDPDILLRWIRSKGKGSDTSIIEKAYTEMANNPTRIPTAASRIIDSAFPNDAARKTLMGHKYADAIKDAAHYLDREKERNRCNRLVGFDCDGHPFTGVNAIYVSCILRAHPEYCPVFLTNDELERMHITIVDPTAKPVTLISQISNRTIHCQDYYNLSVTDFPARNSKLYEMLNNTLSELRLPENIGCTHSDPIINELLRSFCTHTSPFMVVKDKRNNMNTASQQDSLTRLLCKATSDPSLLFEYMRTAGSMLDAQMNRAEDDKEHMPVSKPFTELCQEIVDSHNLEMIQGEQKYQGRKRYK